MRAKGTPPLTVALVALALLAPLVRAQDPTPDLRARWAALSPERKAELKRVHAAWLEGATPEQKKKLRKLAQERTAARKLEGGKAKEKLGKVPADERAKYRELVQRLIKRLPAEERARLAQLPREERQKAIKGLIQAHRLEVLERHVVALPEGQRERLRAELAGVEGQERFKLIRRQLEAHVRAEARGIMAARDLAPPERARRLKQLVQGLPPDMRERLRERLLAEMQKREQQARQRQERGEPPQRPRRPR